MSTRQASEEERFFILSAIHEWRSNYELCREQGDLLAALYCYRQWGKHIRDLKKHAQAHKKG